MLASKASKWAGLVLAFQKIVQAQQFAGYVTPYELLGLSDKCFAAVNTTVAKCPDELARHAGVLSSMNILTTDQLTLLCTTDCRTSLTNVRTSIKNACTGTNDTMVYEQIAYPATWLTDRMLYAYDLSCRKDKTSGQYCDTIALKNLSNNTAAPINETVNCSDCALGVMQYQLGSPFGYNTDYASQFASSTSKCSAASYAYASPTKYALNATTTTATPAACTSAYTIKQGDNCTSVSEALGVSTDNLVTNNGIDRNCTSFPAVGKTLCIPEKCKTYRLKWQDNCVSLVRDFNITTSQLMAWNPILNKACLNVKSWVGWSICVSSPTGTVDVPAGNAATTAAPVPSDAKAESNKKCGQWYRVQDGDQCSTISVKFSITLNDFYFLNPSIDKNCTNLWLSTSYCVKPVGDINTYSSYPTTAPSTTFTRPTTSTTQVQYTTPAMNPRASGTIAGCYQYANTPEWDDSLSKLNDTMTADEQKRCVYTVPPDVSDSDMALWNPSLSSSDCRLKAGFSYCIRKSAPVVIDNGKNCDGMMSSLVVSGTTTSCTCYWSIFRGDFAETDAGCTDLLYQGRVTLAQLRQWNSWMKTDTNCAAAAMANLNEGDQRQICIDTAVQPTPPPNPTTTPAGPTTTTSTSSAPTQSGMVAGCRKQHIAKTGDDCSTVTQQYSITMAQFRAWNTAVDANCNGFWAGYAYCVQGPATTATTTTSSGPPAPTQTGVASNCNKWYKVKTGDGCYDIATANSITLDQFYSWNPAVGNECKNLWPDYAVCVGVK